MSDNASINPNGILRGDLAALRLRYGKAVRFAYEYLLRLYQPQMAVAFGASEIVQCFPVHTGEYTDIDIGMQGDCGQDQKPAFV